MTFAVALDFDFQMCWFIFLIIHPKIHPLPENPQPPTIAAPEDPTPSSEPPQVSIHTRVPRGCPHIHITDVLFIVKESQPRKFVFQNIELFAPYRTVSYIRLSPRSIPWLSSSYPIIFSAGLI